MNSRRFDSEDKSTKRSHVIRRIVHATTNDGSKSSRKSYSPPQQVNNMRGSKHNITNSIIMRRQAPESLTNNTKCNNLGYSFIYDESNQSPKANYEYERKILQQIAKNKPKINAPSPNK